MKNNTGNSVDGFVPRRFQKASLNDSARTHTQTTLGHERPDRVTLDEELHSGSSREVSRPGVASAHASHASPAKEEIGESLKAIDADTHEEKRAKKKKRTTKKRIKLASLLIGAVLLVAGGFLAVKAWQVASRVFQGNLLGIFQRQELKMDANGRSNVLILGSTDDMAGRDGADLTDSMMVVSIDQKKKDAYIFSIPRDLWVNYGRACISGYEGKINAFYACSADGTGKEAETARMNATRTFVGDIFGMEIQYAVHVNTVVIRDGVNAVGGITVNVESEDERGVLDSTFDDMCANAPNLCPQGHFLLFPNGPNEMNGDQAMAFSQARGMGALTYGLEQSNFDREKNQQRVLMALKEKATSTGTLTDITKVMGLMDAMGDNLRTNVDAKEIQTALWLASEIKEADIHRLSFVEEGNLLVTNGTVASQSVVRPVAGLYDYSEIRAYVRDAMVSTPLTQERATVLVLNGGGPSGSAQTEADALALAGLKVAGVDNAPEDESGTYAIYQMATTEKPLAKKELEQRYSVTVKTTAPPFAAPMVADYIVVIGAQANTKVVQ